MHLEPNGHGADVGSLLRAWRAGTATQSGRPLTQKDMAKALGRTDRWYRSLERGTVTRALTRKECETLGVLLKLDQAQRHALFLASVGGVFSQFEARRPPRLSDERRVLVDRLPFPAYVVDSTWNVLAANEAMSELFPWSARPGANLMRWILLSPDAREQHLNWSADAAVCIRILRAAAVARPRDRRLQHLISDTTEDPVVHDLWTASAGDVTEHHDGHVLRMNLPVSGGQPTELVTHVLQPTGLPGCRLTILTRRAGEGSAATPVTPV